MVANIEQKVDKPTIFKVSLWLFLVVFLCTIWIYFYNMSLDSKANDLDANITKVDQTIKLAKEDGYYVVYKQLETNKTVIDKMTYLSNIPEFINNLKALSTQKNVFFNGFTYNNWKISTKVSVINDSVALASLKTKSFIEFFRNPNNHIFSLWFVNAFEWQDRINFNAEFSVK